jgi:hypothetical protein
MSPRLSFQLFPPILQNKHPISDCSHANNPTESGDYSFLALSLEEDICQAVGDVADTFCVDIRRDSSVASREGCLSIG